MVSPSHAGSLSIDRLGPADLVETFGFLDHDPLLNVYLQALVLRDALSHTRDEYWAARRDGRMVAFLHMGAFSGALLPLGEDPEALGLLGDQACLRLSSLPPRFQLIGPRSAVDPFLARFARSGIPPRLDRAQIYMGLARHELVLGERVSVLERARPEDFPMVHESGALMRLEELEEDPRVTDAIGYRRRVEEECRDGHTYLWKDVRGLCFRSSVSARTADAAQISGVYTPPDRRGQGYATRGLGELCARMLEQSRAVCLFVNEGNDPAIAVYRRLGFRARAAWRSVFYPGQR